MKHVIPYNVNIYSGYVAIAVTILVNISWISGSEWAHVVLGRTDALIIIHT